MYAGAMEGAATRPAGRFDPVGVLTVAFGVIERREGRHDILAGLERPAHHVDIGHKWREVNAIRIHGEDRPGIASVFADFFGICDVNTSEIGGIITGEVLQCGFPDRPCAHWMTL